MTPPEFKTVEEIHTHIASIPKAHHLGDGFELLIPPHLEAQVDVPKLFARLADLGYTPCGLEPGRPTKRFVPIDRGHLEVGYYVELQKRLMDIFQFVACDERNFGTFSVALASLFLDAASYFDSLAQNLIRAYVEAGKAFTAQVSVDEFGRKVRAKDNFTMRDYRTLLEPQFGFSTKVLNLNCIQGDYYCHPTSCLRDGAPRFEMEPFREWANDTRPGWWEAFTKVKHDRISHGDQATLRNTLLSFAGVIVVLTVYRPRYMRESAAAMDAFRLFTPLYWKTWGGRSVAHPVFVDR